MKKIFLALTILASSSLAFAQAKVMNPGETHGQVIILSADDVKSETPKYKSLNPLSIPVFGELPLDMSVIAGAVTLAQQTLLSHVQLKSRARHTPNLDISALQGGLSNPSLALLKEGAWIYMKLDANGTITIKPSTEQAATEWYQSHLPQQITLQADLTEKRILNSSQMGSRDAIRVGSKAANYAELANLLNTPERQVVRPSHALPMYYYEEFVNMNPAVKASIESMLRDPLMTRVARKEYREKKLANIQALMTSPDAVVNEQLVTDLIKLYNTFRKPNGKPRKMKMRSSTNSEDLPNFNGAGLYDSAAYDPTVKGQEISEDAKRVELKRVLKTVWASVWNLRAYEERQSFGIPHNQVRMAMQINPSFSNEIADGVVVTKNMSGSTQFTGPGVYIEVQRGSQYSVTNPVANVKPQKILVNYDPANPQNKAAYQVHVLQNSNIADDNTTILPQDNAVPVMTDAEIRDLTQQVMKANAHFGPVLDPKNKNFSLDLEFKVSDEETGSRAVYIKQARPYID